MKYGKLVRDRIPEIIETMGGKSVIHVAEKEEYESMLRKKLQEEVTEFLESSTAEELADILEVVYALGESINISKDELDKLRERKANERGKFEKRLILEES